MTIRDDEGFTLIELLVVVAIIGILAAVAIPQFAAYRQRGFDAQANSDLRNAATSEEAYFATYQAYISCGTFDCPNQLPGFQQSGTSEVQMWDAGNFFGGDSWSDSGSGKLFCYDSSRGGMQDSCGLSVIVS